MFPIPKKDPPLIYTFEVSALPKYYNRSNTHFDDSRIYRLDLPGKHIMIIYPIPKVLLICLYK